MRDNLVGFEDVLYRAIPVGIDNRIKIKRLAYMFRKTERDIKLAIAELRMRKVPVGTLRRNGGGVFIARNEAELQMTKCELRSQITSMQTVLNQLEHAEFEEVEVI